MGFEPTALAAIQEAFAEELAVLNAAAAGGALPALKDRRFAAEAWRENRASHVLAQAYLASARALLGMADAVQADETTRARIRFAVMQWVDAMCPANYLALNPDAQRRLVASSGETLRLGMANLVADIQKARISHTDESQFEVGRNLAVTPGSVIYQNRLMQIIQYSPQTPTVHARPLVMVPPCINKFYILDLQPQNSLVAHLVAEGFTVFMVSWRNPLLSDGDGIHRATWDEYLREGVLQAIDVVREVSGQDQINALGFCVGGTMLASALAVAKAEGKEPVASLTLLTSFLDFSDTGVLDVFVDETHVQVREQQMAAGGLMPARDLASTFSFLRPNDLVWNYVVNSYLKGETPPPFDLLYWNGDSTNLPGPFFTWYLRNTYLENNLSKPGKAVVCGVPLDLGTLDMPAYLYASREDHIVPWQTAYRSTGLLGGPSRFVLGASGHIAGVINPPAAGKRSHWIGTETPQADAEHWLSDAVEHKGSWWPDWMTWLAGHSGRKVKPAATLGSDSYPPIEAAPGSYVRARAL
ncbi:class I poly(R)-hydroxyalkanoic acid synthase [Verticiella sediminum]